MRGGPEEHLISPPLTPTLKGASAPLPLGLPTEASRAGGELEGARGAGEHLISPPLTPARKRGQRGGILSAKICEICGRSHRP